MAAARVAQWPDYRPRAELAVHRLRRAAAHLGQVPPGLEQPGTCDYHRHGAARGVPLVCASCLCLLFGHICLNLLRLPPRGAYLHAPVHVHVASCTAWGAGMAHARPRPRGARARATQYRSTVRSQVTRVSRDRRHAREEPEGPATDRPRRRGRHVKTINNTTRSERRVFFHFCKGLWRGVGEPLFMPC